MRVCTLHHPASDLGHHSYGHRHAKGKVGMPAGSTDLMQSLRHSRRLGRRRQARAASAESDAEPRKAQRGVVVLPGLGNSRTDYTAMAQLMQQEGLAVSIAAVNRVDWLRNAAGLRYLDYWKGTLNPRPTVDWYLRRIDEAVDGLKAQTGGAPITLLAHSAGGWLGRLYLYGFGTAGIDRLVSIGSPHQPPPEDAKIMDQTRGILTHITQTCPGCHHDEVEYVTVAGKYIRGANFRDQDAKWAQKLVGVGYRQVCGFADVWGDGIIPLGSAHLTGANNITLEGVYHSPLGAVLAVDGKPGRPWYGSPEILPQWIGHVTGGAEMKEPKLDISSTLPAAQS